MMMVTTLFMLSLLSTVGPRIDHHQHHGIRIAAGSETMSLSPDATPPSKDIMFMIPPGYGSKQCFYARAKESDKMFLSFQLQSAKPEFSVTVRDPSNKIVYFSTSLEHGEEEKVFFTAKSTGEFSFCFENTDPAEKYIYMELFVSSYQASKTKTPDPLLMMINNANTAIRPVMTDQVYIRSREVDARNTMESNFDRVLYRAAIEIILLLSMSVGQMWYLRRLFDRRAGGGSGGGAMGRPRV